MLVPRALLPRAIAWNSLAGQSASIARPGPGRPAGGHSASRRLTGVSLCLYLAAACALILIRRPSAPAVQPGSRWALVKQGLRYVWAEKIVFGAISLDWRR